MRQHSVLGKIAKARGKCSDPVRRLSRPEGKEESVKGTLVQRIQVTH